MTEKRKAIQYHKDFLKSISKILASFKQQLVTAFKSLTTDI